MPHSLPLMVAASIFVSPLHCRVVLLPEFYTITTGPPVVVLSPVLRADLQTINLLCCLRFGLFLFSPLLRTCEIPYVPNGGLRQHLVLRPNFYLAVLFTRRDPPQGSLFFHPRPLNPDPRRKFPLALFTKPAIIARK